jgi:hypothetical protein
MRDLASVVRAPRISLPTSRTESSPNRSSPSRQMPLKRRSIRDHFSVIAPGLWPNVSV